MATRRFCPTAIFLASVTALGVGIASAQSYPTKPIRIVTGSAGGSNDFTARVVAQGLAAGFGQQVVVDNRPSSAIQVEASSKAPADGYTLLLGGGSLITNPLLGKVPYDPVRDYSPIITVERSVNFVVVHPSVPVKSITALIALAKARPGDLNYASGGTGTSSHLAAELLRYMARINVIHVPYKGTGPALNDLIGGHVQMMINSSTSVSPHVTSGRVRALAVTSAEPTPLAPGLPTVAASVPGFESVGITALFAPAKTPEPIIRQLNEEVTRFLRTADVQEKFFKNGAEVVGGSPEQLSAWMKLEMDRLGKLIKDIGLRVE